jgi:hypothetical protein
MKAKLKITGNLFENLQRFRVKNLNEQMSSNFDEVDELRYRLYLLFLIYKEGVDPKLVYDTASKPIPRFGVKVKTRSGKEVRILPMENMNEWRNDNEHVYMNWLQSMGFERGDIFLSFNDIERVEPKIEEYESRVKK